MNHAPFLRQFFAPRFWPTWLVIALLWLLSWLPARLRRGFGRFLGHQLLGRNAKRREIVMTNLKWSLPELEGQHEAIARGYFSYAGQMMLELGFFWWAGRRRMLRQIELEGMDQLQQELDRGRTVMLITAHFVPVDFGGIALSANIPDAMYFANRTRNPLLDWFLNRGRCRFGGESVMRENNLRPVIRRMRNGTVSFVYIVVDEDLGAQGSQFAPFFGVQKATLVSPIRMAKMSGASVIPCMTYYRPSSDTYVFRLLPPLNHFPSGDDNVDAGRVNKALEEMIRVAPEQYMWSLRLFQTRPDGSPPPYTMKGKPGSGPRPRPQDVKSEVLRG